MQPLPSHVVQAIRLARSFSIVADWILAWCATAPGWVIWKIFGVARSIVNTLYSQWTTLFSHEIKVADVPLMRVLGVLVGGLRCLGRIAGHRHQMAVCTPLTRWTLLVADDYGRGPARMDLALHFWLSSVDK